MKTLALLAVAALAAAALLAALASREPFAERLVRLEAAAAAPAAAARLADESLAVNAAVVELAGTPELRLSAELALLRYPELSGEVLARYAGAQEFQDVLVRFGPAVIPPIGYFLRHEVRSLEVLRAAGSAVEGARRAAARLVGKDPEAGAGAPRPGAATTFGAQPLTPEERGWYAIAFIREEGHGFLGQFVVAPDGRVEWVQTERLTEAAAGFFTGGIRSLETKLRRDEVPVLSDYLWAGVDVVVAASAVKVLRLGRAAGTGTRGALAARTVARGGRGALRAGRHALPVAVAYAVVRHPSLISGLGAQLARVMGWPVVAVQGAVWFAVLLPLLVVLRLLLLVLARPLLWILAPLTRGLRRAQRRRRAARRTRDAPQREWIVPRLGDLPPPPDEGGEPSRSR